MDFDTLQDDLSRIGRLLKDKKLEVLRYEISPGEMHPVMSNQLNVLVEGLAEVNGDKLLEESEGLEATVYFFDEPGSPYDRIKYTPGAMEGELQAMIFPDENRTDNETEQYLQDVNEVIEKF